MSPTSGRSKQDQSDQEMRIGWRMGGLGMEVASEVVAGIFLGWAFDKWRGTAPKGLLTGAIIGIVVALWTLIHGSLKLNKLLDEKYPTAGRGRPLPPDDSDQDDDDDWPDNDRERAENG